MKRGLDDGLSQDDDRCDPRVPVAPRAPLKRDGNQRCDHRQSTMPRRNPRRNISRIELTSAGGRQHGGWEVRIQRQGRKFNRFFADRRCGGKRGALNRAKQFRDKLEGRLKPYTTAMLAEFRSRRNTSGVVGVRLGARTVECDGEIRTYRFWVAQWTNGPGRRKSRSFSIARYGDDDAFEMAQAARRVGVQRAGRTL